jgi:hypothetical protein
MKRILYLSILFMVTFASAQAQEILFNSGISFHSLSQMKSFQNSLNNEFFVPMKSTQSFPSYLQFGITYRSSLRTKPIRVGTSIYTTSTAARSTYSDYSGTQQLDFKLWCLGISGYINYRVKEFNKSELSFYGHTGTLFNKLNTDFIVQLGDNTEHSRESFKSLNLVVELGVEYKYFLNPKFFVELQGGMHLNSASDMQSTGNGNSIPAADWTGFKLMICVGYSFDQIK